MADKFAENYTLDSADNVFSAVWKLTRVMKAAGWDVKAHSNGTTKVSAGTNANDSWGSNADPLTDTYPAFNTAVPWIVLEGPRVHKFPLSGNFSGTFLRGEQVVQSVSGATGEIIGIIWDTSTMSGWAGVLPRTGTFDGVNAVTGQLSGASFTPSSIKTFTREVVFWKQNNTSQGTCYYIVAEVTAESAQLFSVLAASAGATATVAPGGGGTGNGFPALGLCMRGTGGSTGHANWLADLSTGFGLGAFIGCANATPGAGVSADGSFYMYVSRGSPTGSVAGFFFSRLDDTEPGDIEPYIWYWNAGISPASWVRTSSSSFNSSREESWTNLMNQSFVTWRGYIARDCPVVSRDVPAYYWGAYRGGTQNTYFPTMNFGQPLPQNVANHPSTTTPYVRDFVSLVTSFGTIRNHKGTVRWMTVLSTGTYKDTIDNKTWMCIVPYLTSGNPSVFIGPFDGVSTPSPT